jgi:uncharacterized protein (TIGR00299 family) protein
MKICYLDPFSGISGDMTVGALLDAGASFPALERALASLNAGATVSVERVKRKGISASKFRVAGGEQKAHRHLHHIVRMIEGGEMAEPVKQTALAIFQRLAEAEAKVHGTGIEKVHFHEVGAVDSICDIVGAAFCLHDLGIAVVSSAAINSGSGTANTEHGVLPVPTPATAELLAGKPIYARGPQVELTTPTGAAIVAALAKSVGPMPPMQIAATGYGAGDRDFPEHANVLRVLIGDTTDAVEAVTIAVIETNIDDSSPQVLGYAMERLLEAGALDVTLTPVYMKKNRPGTMLTVLATPENREQLAALVLRETSALGLRIHSAERRVEARSFEEVETQYGRVRMKVSGSGGFAPEYDDCRRIAQERGVPVKEVLAEASLAYLKATR